MFDPSNCFSSSIESKRQKIDTGVFEAPCAVSNIPSPVVATVVATAPPKPTTIKDDGVPSSLPVFVLPPEFVSGSSSLQQQDDRVLMPPPPPPAPTSTSGVDDPRRKAFAFHDEKFPMAGLFYEEGGLFGHLDARR